MKERLLKFLKKATIVTTNAICSVALLATSFASFTLMQPVTVSAASPTTSTKCPQDTAAEAVTNIIYCGLDGSTSKLQSISFQNYYNANSDANPSNPTTHNDLQRIYKAVATMSVGSFNTKMFQSGRWEIGTSKNDGNIYDVNGNIVGTNTQITSRCPSMKDNCSGSEFIQLTDASGNIGNIHYRAATAFFDKEADTMPTLLHFNASNQLDFAVWSQCGNALIFKQVVPKQSLVCDSLTADKDTKNPLLYHFTAKATAQNVAITSYKLNFGNGTVKSFSSASSAFTTDFTYSKTDLSKVLTAIAFVNGTVTSGNCQAQIPPVTPPTFACLNVSVTPESQNQGSETLTLAASTQGTDTASSYTFVFGDGSNATQSSNTITHMYSFDTTSVHTFSGYFTATSTTGLKTDQNDKNCQFSFSTQLVRTGPEGTFAIFAGASTLGIALHQFLLRRKLAL